MDNFIFYLSARVPFLYVCNKNKYVSSLYFVIEIIVENNWFDNIISHNYF